MPIAWQIEQTGWTGRDWKWKCSLFRFSGHLCPWTAFNVKKKLTTAYAIFCNNWGIFFKYCEHLFEFEVNPKGEGKGKDHHSSHHLKQRLKIQQGHLTSKLLHKFENKISTIFFCLHYIIYRSRIWIEGAHVDCGDKRIGQTTQAHGYALHREQSSFKRS